MSMTCTVRQVGEAEITALLADPGHIGDFLYGDDERQGDDTDLDKAWHGIHFMLTGSAWAGDAPLCYLVVGGQDIGDEDVGYGPARLLRPSEVEQFDAALAAISLDDFCQRYNPSAMLEQDVYPAIWDRTPPKDDPLGYLAEHFAVLKAVVRDSVAHHRGLLIWLT